MIGVHISFDCFSFHLLLLNFLSILLFEEFTLGFFEYLYVNSSVTAILGLGPFALENFSKLLPAHSQAQIEKKLVFINTKFCFQR